MDKEGMLNDIFVSKGSDHGYLKVTAQFSAERDLKISWIRAGTLIDFWISDYLEDASKEVLESLADTMYKRISSFSREPYSDLLLDYVTDPDFISNNRKTYLTRVNGISKSPVGRHHDLSKSYMRLVDSELVEYDPKVVLRWAPQRESKFVGHSSVLMKTICINRMMDCKYIPEEVIDYALFSQLSFIDREFGDDPKDKIEDVKRTMTEFPDYKRLDKAISDIGMTLWGEVSPRTNTLSHGNDGDVDL